MWRGPSKEGLSRLGSRLVGVAVRRRKNEKIAVLFERPARRLLRAALDVVLPPRCIDCRSAVDRQGGLCPECWKKLSFIEGTVCAVCGYPVETESGGDALCGACARRRPPYARARAALRYDDASRDLILAFKNGDRTELAPTFGTWMSRCGADLLNRCDVVVPVPLHWRRLFRRRYNQSALLARSAASARRNVSVLPDALRRLNNDPSQAGRKAAARRDNVRSAFGVSPRATRDLRNSRALVVDDVFTTGATVEACARTLLAAGAAEVSVLTLSRVVRSDSDSI